MPLIGSQVTLIIAGLPTVFIDQQTRKEVILRCLSLLFTIHGPLFIPSRVQYIAFPLVGPTIYLTVLSSITYYGIRRIIEHPNRT